MKKSFIQDVFFFLFLISLSLAFYRILAPFILDIFLAVILAHLFSTLFKNILKRTKLKRKKASLLVTMFVFLTIIIPSTVLSILFSNEVIAGYTNFQTNWPGFRQEMREVTTLENINKIPIIGRFAEKADIAQIQLRVGEEFDRLVRITVRAIFRSVQQILVNIFNIFMHLFFMLFFMYYILIDGASLKTRIHALLPLSDEDENELFQELIKNTDATVLGTFLIGIMEGLFCGLICLAFGIASPVVIGIFSMVCSMIPIIGANFILLPVGIWQLFLGNYAAGLIIIITGTTVITISQYIIKPRLLGNRSGLHPAIILVAIIGGIMWLGPIGFLVGPLIAALFIVIWNQFGSRYKKELINWNKQIKKSG